MLCGKELIVATKPFAREIRKQSWFHLLSTLAVLALAMAGSLWMPHLALRLLSSMIAGLLVVRMFIIYHDHQHHSILTKSAPANLIMTLFGLYILSPSSIWKRSHDHHHKHNSKLFSASIGSYPIVTRKKFLEMSTGQQRAYLATRHPLTIALGYLTMFVYGMCVRSFLSSPKKHADSLLALVLHVAVSVVLVLFLGWQSWLLVYILPLFVACGLGAYLFYAQHNFPGVSFYESGEWVYEKAALDSSSYMDMSPLMAWFTGNIGYHHIHHLNARIPFYRLPEVMDHFAELQQCKRTSLHPREIRACLRLKVWDPEANRMIGLRELKKPA